MQKGVTAPHRTQSCWQAEFFVKRGFKLIVRVALFPETSTCHMGARPMADRFDSRRKGILCTLVGLGNAPSKRTTRAAARLAECSKKKNDCFYKMFFVGEGKVMVGRLATAFAFSLCFAPDHCSSEEGACM